MNRASIDEILDPLTIAQNEEL